MSFLPLIWQESAVVVLTHTTCYWKMLFLYLIWDHECLDMSFIALLRFISQFSMHTIHTNGYTNFLYFTEIRWRGMMKGKKMKVVRLPLTPLLRIYAGSPSTLYFAEKQYFAAQLVFWNHDIYYERTQVTFITTQSFKNDDNEDDHDNWWFLLYPSIYHVCICLHIIS